MLEEAMRIGTIAFAACAFACAVGCAPQADVSVERKTDEIVIEAVSDLDGPAEPTLEDERNWIREHPDAVACDGEVVQEKLLALAENEDEAVAYVRHFSEQYPADSSEGSKGSAYPDDTPVPHLYQWDQRWGYTVYSSTAFGLTGCGPTAFAMAYQGVTGKDDLSPYDAGLLAQEMGYMAEFEGTPASFLGAAASRLGIVCESIGVNQASLIEALESGRVLIANVGHGYFSRFDGHYLVLTGIDDEGKLVMNDPYSAVHSQQRWDIDFIIDQTKGLYSFWA